MVDPAAALQKSTKNLDTYNMCNHDKLKINEVWEHLFFTLMSHFGAIFSELARKSRFLLRKTEDGLSLLSLLLNQCWVITRTHCRNLVHTKFLKTGVMLDIMKQ